MTSEHTSSRHRFQLDPQYVCIPKFKNDLPTAPSGPFFQKVPLSHSKKDYGAYRAGASLEKNYIWQPHLGPDVGMGLNLVDPAEILIKSDPSHKPLVPPEDQKYLVNAADTRSHKGSAVDQHWLRKTEYVASDLFRRRDQRHKDKTSIDAENMSSKVKKRTIDEDFDAVREKVAIMGKANKVAKIEWVSDFLPDLDRWESKFTLASFAENPSKPGTASQSQQSQSGGDEDDDNDRGLITNIRPMAGGEWMSSFFVPSEVDDDDAEHFQYVQDLKLKIMKKTEANSLFAVQIRTDGSGTTYFPLRGHIDMKRLVGVEVPEHEIAVSRRPKNDDEKSLSDAFLSEINEMT
jgi:hypothetical protein